MDNDVQAHTATTFLSDLKLNNSTEKFSRRLN